MNITTVVIAVQLMAFIVSLFAIVYLIIRRIRKKKSEHFEKRDN
jgi:preprotein translocase subunit YajC